jgi:hypothetical protein
MEPMSYEPKTKPTIENVEEFLKANCTGQKLQDCLDLVALMEKLTGKKARMWGSSIVGCGKYHYKYASGHEGDSAVVGFSPRKTNITIYISTGFGSYMDESDTVKKLMSNLGKYKTGKVCLYITKLSDVDLDILTKLIINSIDYMKRNYETDLS